MHDSWAIASRDLLLALDRAGGGRRVALERERRDVIRDGRLPAGTPLPSTRALAQDLGLARGTVSEAYAQLVAEGYLLARQGAGTVVAAGAAEAEPPAPAAAEPPPRADFRPGRPDLSSFPRPQW